MGFTYLQSMDFQREPQSKHHLYCEQDKPAHCHGSLLLRVTQLRIDDVHCRKSAGIGRVNLKVVPN